MTGWTKAVCLSSLWLGAGVASAEMRPEAQGLYDAGKRELEAGRYDAAAFNFRRSLALVEPGTEDHWQLLVALALAADKAKRPSDALEYFGEFVAQSDPATHTLSAKWKARRDKAVETLAKLERDLLRTHAKVRITSRPPGAAIKVDGLPVGADLAARTPFLAYLPAGAHQVELRTDGYPPQTRAIEAVAGASASLEVVLERPSTPEPVAKPEPPPAVEVPVTATPEAEVTARERSTPVLGWVGVGVGGACLAVGAVFLGLAGADVQASKDLEEDLGQDVGHARYVEIEESFQRNRIVSGVFLGVGAALAVGGVVYLIMDAQDGGSDTPGEPQVQIVPSRDGVAGVVRGRF